jgi:hypothetical protein
MRGSWETCSHLCHCQRPGWHSLERGRQADAEKSGTKSITSAPTHILTTSCPAQKLETKGSTPELNFAKAPLQTYRGVPFGEENSKREAGNDREARMERRKRRKWEAWESIGRRVVPWVTRTPSPRWSALQTPPMETSPHLP